MSTLLRNETLLLPGHSFSAQAAPNHEMINLRGLGMLAIPSGGDRGYNTEGDVLTQTIDGRNLNDIWDEFQQTLALHNESRQALISALTYGVSSPVEEVPQVSQAEFEEASEFGEPKGISGAGFFSMGFDFKWYDLAIRYTWKYLAEATAAQVESLNNMAIEADTRLRFTRIMRAAFNNSNGTTDIRGNPFTVYRFYNGDGTVPPDFKNNSFDGTENHYMVSGADTVASTDLDALEEQITEHGYGPPTGGILVLMVNRQEMATIRSFRVADGDSYDFVPAANQPPFLLPTNTGGVEGGRPPSDWNGLPVAGQYGKFIVIEEDYIPAGYLLSFASGGELAPTNPIGVREHQNAGLRGLRLVKGRDNDYPLIDSFYQRGFGTGIRHRGAGAIMQIKASGSYEVPSQYA